MIGEWCYFQSRFTKKDCQKILDYAADLPETRAEIGTKNGVKVVESYRRSNVRFIQHEDERFNFLFDDVWRMAVRANDDWFGFNITKLSYIQFAEYSAEYAGMYKKHHDVFWINNDPKYHRKLTCVIQLSDPADYDGGDLEFFDLAHYPDPAELRAQGTAIIFPSFLYHAAAPVTRGVRHSLACWLDGPKWQ